MALPHPQRYDVLADGSHLIYKRSGASIRYPQYHYSPLSTKRSIRLLRPNFDLANPLHRSEGRFNHFLIEEHSLDDHKLKYVPISYVWGEAEATIPVMLGSESNGSVCLVTPTAWKIIHKMCAHPLKDEPDPPPLWIDQVCINQKDDDERSAQVDLMGEIYSGPGRFATAVWLGDADDTTKKAFDFVETLSSTLPLDKKMPVNPNDVLHLPHDVVRRTIQSNYPAYNPPADDDPGWGSLAMILGQTWFLRMWTFQEVVLSNDDNVSVVCARWDLMCKTTLRKIMRASILLGDYPIPEYNNAVLEGRTSLYRIMLAHYLLRTKKPVPLHLSLDWTAGRECKDPRDKIYAVLNAQSRDVNRVEIKADYKRPIPEVYADATRKIIASESSFLMCLSASGRQGGTVTGLPSWVPDFTGKALATPMEALDPNSPLFSANHGRRLEKTLTKKTAWSELLVQGRQIDTATKVIPSDMPENGTGEVLYSYLCESLPKLLNQLTGPSDNNRTLQTMFRIARTLIHDGYGAHLFGLRRFSFISQTSNEEPSTTLSRIEAEEEDIAMLKHMFSIDSSASTNMTEERQRQWKLDFLKQAVSCRGRRFALLKNHGFGLVPRSAEDGNIVTVLYGSSLPVVLRVGKIAGRYELVGPCFVDGIMRGEAVDWRKDRIQEFVLV